MFEGSIYIRNVIDSPNFMGMKDGVYSIDFSGKYVMTSNCLLNVNNTRNKMKFDTELHTIEFSSVRHSVGNNKTMKLYGKIIMIRNKNLTIYYLRLPSNC
jgi:hypothetical protein